MPYPGDDAAYYLQLRTGQVQPIRDVLSSVPEQLARVVDRCLHRQAARRYLDAQELLDELVALGQPAPGTSEALHERLDPRRSARRSLEVGN